ncbi:YciI family protein [Corynebacterium callunae]|uniref:YciI family protein n=1 Tax=Corynebacterium callunae TaxID=1721 RepID=UPI000AD8F065|nr:YciI family protein [Corynebacterium callunae]
MCTTILASNKAAQHNQSEEAMQASFAQVEAFNKKLIDDGHFVYACGLTPPESAQVVNPDATITAGPAVSGDKMLGGFWVIEASSPEVAVALAEQGAAACGQPVELRPMQ